MAKAGRPTREFDVKQFNDLIALGCKQDEICWWFRDDKGKPANPDTLSRWCERKFGVNFQEYSRENGGMHLKIQLRKNQLELSAKNAAMAIFLGKNYLEQTDRDPLDLKLIEARIAALEAGQGGAIDDKTRAEVDALIEDIEPIEEAGEKEGV